MEIESNAYPQELTALDRWAQSNFDHETHILNKRPLTPSGAPASSTNATTWSSFDDVMMGDRIGYMMGEGRFTVIDLDAPKDATAEEGEVFQAYAANVIRIFDSYTEVSNSGKGYHIFVEGQLANSVGRRKRKGAVEIYSDFRYLIVTGQRIKSTPGSIMDRAELLQQFYDSVFPVEESVPMPLMDGTGAGLDYDAIMELIYSPTYTDKTLAAIWSNGISNSDEIHGAVGKLVFYTRNKAVITSIILDAAEGNGMSEKYSKDRKDFLRKINISLKSIVDGYRGQTYAYDDIDYDACDV